MMEYAIIVAGGSGSRMQSTTPKQFLEVGGIPILMRTIKAFHKYSQELIIILVIPSDQFDYWNEIVTKHKFSIPHKLVPGGTSRFESVKNGLHALQGNGFVAIHDGVRPFISTRVIGDCFDSAKKYGSGVAVVTPKDSIRKILEGGNRSTERDHYRLVQTPQTFEISIIKEAYMATLDKGFTDDASVAENNSNTIALVEGEYRNIKITTPEDIKIAQALLDKNNNI
jgi:2-C-methyl-D-erythritol 4-phosphate cytidylyltransferase